MINSLFQYRHDLIIGSRPNQVLSRKNDTLHWKSKGTTGVSSIVLQNTLTFIHESDLSLLFHLLCFLPSVRLETRTKAERALAIEERRQSTAGSLMPHTDRCAARRRARGWRDCHRWRPENAADLPASAVRWPLQRSASAYDRRVDGRLAACCRWSTDIGRGLPRSAALPLSNYYMSVWEIYQRMEWRDI